MILIAWICPWLALLMISKPFSAVFNFLIWCCGFLTMGGGFVIATAHGMYTVHEWKREKGMVNAIIKADKKMNAETIEQTLARLNGRTLK